MRCAIPLLILFAVPSLAADPPKRDWQPVDLVGKAREFRAIRDYRAYYWRDDFTFLFDDEKTNKTWRVISREPTPAYTWRMGPTQTSLKVDWAKNPRVKLLGVAAIDRIPLEFHDLKLDEKNTITVLVLWVETQKDKWEEFYVNNWFHKWGDKADKAIYSAYAGKKAPYDVYGFTNGQAAPFSKKSLQIMNQFPRGNMFHGTITATKDNPFGYEIDLIHLIGRDAQGSGAVLYGDPRTLPPLDSKK